MVKFGLQDFNLKMQDSSSSFSMSLSGSDTFEDQPSTSGCSSDMTHKEKRKARVKQYLRQLKAMVPPSSGKKGKMGTLSALQHVIGSLQKIQEEKDKSQLASGDALVEELDNSLFDKEYQLDSQVLKTEETVHVVLTMNEFAVLKVSENVTQILGYPTDSWINRSLSHFVHKKDIVTIHNSLNVEELVQVTDYDDSPVESKPEVKKVSRQIRKKFFFRIRNYKGLQHSGFSLIKPDRFTTVQATMSIGYYPERNKADSPSSFSSSEDCVQKGRKCIFLDCTPLRPLYNVENVQLDKQTFHMRHTIYCSYSYMHPNAIPLLGYLPQDLNGMSIFDFYHKDDLETLCNIYKRIVVSKGTTFKSKPIRLRTRNGAWLTVETEWSSFANPWSHRLEFIIGQHRVIKPPTDCNVFCEAEQLTMIPMLNDHHHKLQQKIRQMLLEPVSEEKTVVKHEPTTDSSDDLRTSQETEKVQKKSKQQTEKYVDRKAGKCSESLQSTESLGRSSLQTFPEHETSMAYEQLNYANSIKRYLMSQQKTYSSSSEKKTTSEEETDTPCTISTTTAEASDSEFEVDISVPKPPSFGSSTKVLLSEQEQREDIAGSPAHQIEDNTEEISTSPGAVAPTSMLPPPSVENMDTIRLLTLTQDALLRHTKQQEDLFVAHAKQDRTPIILKSKEGGMLQERKRSHSPDHEKGFYRPTKASRNDSNILIPPFPLPNIGYPVQYRQGKASNAPRGGNVNGGQQIVSQSGLPVSSTKLSQSNVESRATPIQSNVIWPYYPQTASGASFYPQVMGGFYHDPNGIPATLSLNVTSTIPPTANTTGTTMSGASRHNLKVLQGRCQGPFQLPTISTTFSSSSDMSISHTDSGSSYLYLLDSDDQNSSGQELETKSNKVTRSNKRQTEPPWLETICWTKKLAMNYQLPKRKKNRVLKSDEAFIAKSKPSNTLLQQMMDLQSEIDLNQGAPAVDEENDYLFYLDDEEEDQASDCDSRFIALQDIHEALSQCENHSSGIGCYAQQAQPHCPPSDDRNPSSTKSSEKLEDSSGDGIDISLGPEEEPRCEGSQEQENRMDCRTSIENQPSLETQSQLETQEAMDNQGPLDTLSMDIESNCSKSSSDLTPSDERSSGEAGSSLKESDAMSSKDSVDESKDSSESDVDVSNSTKKDNYHLYFVIPPISFVDHGKTPFWCRNCEMTPVVEMEYTVKSKDCKRHLDDDMRSLKDVVQPDLVKTQMGYMLEELNLSKKLEEKIDSGTKETEGNRGLLKKSASHSKPKSEHFLTEDVFDGMFVTMLGEDIVPFAREESPDVEDVSHRLEKVD